VEVVFGQGKWISRVGKRLTNDRVSVCSLSGRPYTVERPNADRHPWYLAELGQLVGGLSANTGLRACSSPNQYLGRESECKSGVGVALAHDTIADHLLRSGYLVRPLLRAALKEAYYLITPDGSHTNAAAQAFKAVLRGAVPSGT
jgi:DNA-binding transcriptional LysR family regulator